MQFVALLVGTVVLVGGLTFFPALSLGPVVAPFALQAQAVPIEYIDIPPRRFAPWLDPVRMIEFGRIKLCDLNPVVPAGYSS